MKSEKLTKGSWLADKSLAIRRGFSFIEVLVVLILIGLLIALLLPVLAQTRERANTLECMSKLRQIGIAIHGYAAANEGVTPGIAFRHEYPVDVPWIDPPGTWSGPGWPLLLERYIGQKADGRIWNCPSFPEKRVNYFLSARWITQQAPKSLSISLAKIKMSTSYVLAGECSNEKYYPPSFGTDGTSDFEDIDKDDVVLKCLIFAGEPDGYNMHHQGNNVLFSDGHVATFRKWDAGSLTYSPLVPGVTWESLSVQSP